VVLGAAQRTRLKKLAATASAPYRQVWRAKILLAAADNRWSRAAIARRYEAHPDTVRRLCARFREEGEAALVDRPRPGRPPLRPGYPPGDPDRGHPDHTRSRLPLVACAGSGRAVAPGGGTGASDKYEEIRRCQYACRAHPRPGARP